MPSQLVRAAVVSGTFILFSLSSSAPHAAAIATVPGMIFDFDSGRILYEDFSGTLKIRNRTTGTDSIVLAGKSPVYGFLAPNGAIFAEQSGDVLTSTLYDWHSGTLTNLGSLNSEFSLRVNGNYATWNTGTGGQTLLRRNLTTQQDVAITNNAGNNGNSVTTSGDVAYWSSPYSSSDYNIYTWHNGITSQVTHDSLPIANVYPAYDGTNLVYKKFSLESGQVGSLVMQNSSGEMVLAPDNIGATPPPFYQVNNGWTAYIVPVPKPCPGSISCGDIVETPVWLRAPVGTLTEVADPRGPQLALIDFLAPDGEYSYRVGGALYVDGHHVYDVDPLAEQQFGGGSIDRRYTTWLDGKWYVVYGGMLTLVPEPSELIFLIAASLLIPLMARRRRHALSYFSRD
jgi:hypothetical protein